MRPIVFHTRRGFTLIEAIAAIVILSVSVPAMLWAVRTAMLRRVDPIMASRARWLATERLEDVIADRHSPSRGYTYVVNANYAAEASITGFPGFTRSVNIAETAVDLTSTGTGYKTVRVSVGYTDSRGTARTLSLATVITDYTP